jgi:hypothetical protein
MSEEFLAAAPHEAITRVPRYFHPKPISCQTIALSTHGIDQSSNSIPQKNTASLYVSIIYRNIAI